MDLEIESQNSLEINRLNSVIDDLNAYIAVLNLRLCLMMENDTNKTTI